MRQIIIEIKCDKCNEFLLEDETRTTVITVKGQKNIPPREMDLCHQCWDFNFEGLRTTAINPSSEPPKSVKEECDLCGGLYATGVGITLHKMRKHPEEN